MFSSKDIFLGRGAGATGYQISRSVRLRSSASAYFNRTPSSAGNRQKFTWSAWVKRGTIGTGTYKQLFQAGSSTARDSFFFDIDTPDTLMWYGGLGYGAQYGVRSLAVFRDPSAWYHIVWSADTTQATAADRLKLYVNGVQQTLTTAFGSGFLPQNTSMYVDSTVLHTLGSNDGTSEYFDGYLTEINFIDGLALTPSSFGATSTTTGVWGPTKYTGTYGTNGFYLPFSLNNTSSYGASFSGSGQYLTLASNTAFNIFNGDMTVECWFYANSFTNSPHIFAFVQDSSNRESLYFNSSALTFYTSSSAGSGNRIATGTLTTGVWYHCAVVKSGSTFTLYLNGVAIGTSTTAQYSTANQSLQIGTYNSGGFSGDNFNGYISNVRVVKGTAVYTANFIPPTSALTAITNTQLLTLQNATIVDNSTNAFSITNTGSVATSTQYPFANPTIGADASGNANEWLPNNINVTTTGATYDSMVDTPTPYGSGNAGGDVRGNYCVLNPLSTASTLTNGNLYFNSGGAGRTAMSTFYASSGKWYAEFIPVSLDSAGNTQIGVSPITETRDGYASSWMYLASSGNKVGPGSGFPGSAYGASYTTNDVIGVALDMDAGNVVFYKNNVSQGTMASGFTGLWTFSTRGDGTCSHVANFGQKPFVYTAPTGFKAFTAQNLSTPTIANGAGYMAATLYTGTGSSQTVSNAVNSVSFQPDFVWVKGRSGATDHALYDSVRGTTKDLVSNSSAAETTQSTGLTAFGSTGFTVGALAKMNTSAATYVGWQWLAGAGSSSSNTSGSITSTVSVNTTAGFSVATFTTQASSTGTFGHGLGVAPSMVILKLRAISNDWNVYHTSIGATKYLYLDTTAGAGTSTAVWNDTAPTSSVVTLGTSWAGSYTAVAYCFAAIAGYSAFGSYTGNGSADGTFVYLGFRPRWIMVKCSSNASTNWVVIDTSRDTYNLAGQSLEPNLSAAEYTPASSGYPVDILSNGFKWRDAGSQSDNYSGYTYIYAAFAENPFKYSLAR